MIAIRSILVVFACVCLVASAGASAAVELKVARKGSYVYWLSYTDASGSEQITLPQRFKGTGTQIDTKVLGRKYSDARLYVMDRTTGNMAVTDLASAEDGPAPIELAADDFQYVRCVRLRIVSEDNRPLERAVVTITDGMNTRMRSVVTPADEGVATFTNVATGEINVKVEADGLKKTIDSDITLPEKRETRGFEQDVRVAGDVDTLPAAARTGEPAEGERGAGPETPVAQGRSSWILQTVAGLIFMAVVVAIVYAVVKARGMTAESALRRMGVQLPQDQEDARAVPETQPAGPAVDPGMCEFCGQRKDAAGNCACTVTPSAGPGPAAAEVPRLIGAQGVYSGRVFEITAPSMVIGRDAANDIALPDDSTVSRKHAVIASAGGEFTITDQGSSNGTFVNGARITSQKLAPGDEIQIGGTKFRFEL